MKVKNHTVDVMGRANLAGHYPLKRDDKTMSARAYARLVREAEAFFDGFGLDFSQYGNADVSLMEDVTVDITWTHKASGQEIELSYIHFDRKTGEILQAGTNYGRLGL